MSTKTVLRSLKRWLYIFENLQMNCIIHLEVVSVWPGLRPVAVLRGEAIQVVVVVGLRSYKGI